MQDETVITNIYAGGRKLAEAADAVVTWSHAEPVTGSGGNRGFNMDGTPYFDWRAEFNADGVNVGIRAPADVEPPDFPDRILQFSSYGYGPGCSAGNPTCPACYLDGVKQNCAQVAQLMGLGVARQCPHNDCGPHTMTVTGRTADGRLVGSSTFIVTPGSPGWDGSLDGTYRTGSAFSSQFNFNDSSSMRALVAAVGIYPSIFGSSSMEFFERVGGGSGSQLFAHAPQNSTDLKINHAFGDAATAISQKKGKKKDPCKDFFTQGRSLEEVSKIFKSFWQSATYDPSLGAMAGTKNSGQGMAATLRLGSAFFLDEDNGTQGTGLSWSPVNNIYLTTLTNLTPRQNRALTILHEFAHALDLIPRDRDDPGQSTKNDAIIYEKCGSILDSLPWRD